MTVLTWFVLAFAGVNPLSDSGPQIAIRASQPQVGKYEKLELSIETGRRYENPFDPQEVDLTVRLSSPSGKTMVLPAFFCQDYERRKMNQGRTRENWFYPLGGGAWKARFAPMETGGYSAVALLKDKIGTAQSSSIRFECTASKSKGFLTAGRSDPRFFEFSEGQPFFVIGQNLAYISGGQYVNLTKAEEIFAKLSENGANFLRIWTCCKDWAMAIEARKSAWGRSWGGKLPIVPIPGGDDADSPRKCVKLEGGDGASINVEPCHPVPMCPQKRYVLSGRFMADGPSGLRMQLSHGSPPPIFAAAPDGKWTQFRHEFVAGENDYWLGRLAFSLTGSGKVWLDNLSLKEIDGAAELLWEADVNRPERGYYNQVDCFILDKVIEAAEPNGIYLMLCLITRDLYMDSLSKVDSDEYRRAVQDAQNFMRYAVARWGYSTGVGAWEYFNEMDPGKPTDKFYDEVGKYLEDIDFYKHLRTTSTWHPSAKDCRHGRIDIGQLHHYMRTETKEDFKDEVAVIIEKTRFLREHAPNKPVLIGEFGLATPKWGQSEYMKQDKEMAHFNTSLWASAFAGGSGTAMFWWWDQLDRQDAYGRYRPLALFLKGVSFSGLDPIKAALTDGDARILGYQGPDRAYFWLSDPKAAWWNLVVEKLEPAETKPAAIEIRGLNPGDYSVEWWDTRAAAVVRTDRISLAAGTFRATVPAFKRDIACKVKRQ
ncbi:MAG: DUF5060 domain-containing protein [Sedimentisphaerales bacterium]|nr:DUF5060 domain-containing protein [Sedimentisphaerales bacterium]